MPLSEWIFEVDAPCNADPNENSPLGVDIVTAKAGSGENEETFSLYRKLICQKVTFFGKVFNSQFIDGTSQQATLPEVSPNAFRLSRA